MKAIAPRYAVAGLLVSSLLAACSPNPAVLQERVYGSTPVSPPPVARPPATSPAARPPVAKPASKRTAPAKPVTPQQQQPVVQQSQPQTLNLPLPQETSPRVEPIGSQPPVIAEEKPRQPEVSVATPKVYKSSSAVKSLVGQADAEADKGELDKAIETVERALRIESDNPDLWVKLAKLHERQGNHQQAIAMLEKARYYQELLD